MPSTAKQAEPTSYENVRATPFTKVHGRPSRLDYEILKSEASALASEVEDITYDWSHDDTNDYGLLADILGFDEYSTLTTIDTYVAPVEPATYDPTITNVTLTHKRKRKEEDWDRIRQSWFIWKGFLKGIVDNLRDALDEQYYSQLKNRLTAYRNITPFQILDHLDSRWCPLDVHKMGWGRAPHGIRQTFGRRTTSPHPIRCNHLGRRQTSVLPRGNVRQ